MAEIMHSGFRDPCRPADSRPVAFQRDAVSGGSGPRKNELSALPGALAKLGEELPSRRRQRHAVFRLLLRCGTGLRPYPGVEIDLVPPHAEHFTAARPGEEE